MDKLAARKTVFNSVQKQLAVNPFAYTICCEEFDGAWYAMTLLSHNSKNCIIATCPNISASQNLVEIIQI